jgi:L-lactate dehydrogenase complex protein LldG
MKVSAAKENILKKIRQALSHSTPLPFPHSEGNSSVFLPPHQEPEIEFAEQFTKLLGKFVFCVNQEELIGALKNLISSNDWKKIFCREEKLRTLLATIPFGDLSNQDLSGCDAAITSCELLIARTGSILMSAAQQSGRTVSVYAPVHICIAYTDQLRYDIRDGLQFIKEKYQGQLPSLITLATGPSRTADIEKTLVVGVHGPKEVYLFLVDQRTSC